MTHCLPVTTGYLTNVKSFYYLSFHFLSLCCFVIASCVLSRKSVCLSSCIFFFFFCFLGAAPVAYGGFQARGQIRATAVGLHHSHSNVGSKPRLWPTPQFTAMPDPQATERGQGLSNLMVTSQIRFPPHHNGSSFSCIFNTFLMLFPVRESPSACFALWKSHLFCVRL